MSAPVLSLSSALQPHWPSCCLSNSPEPWTLALAALPTSDSLLSSFVLLLMFDVLYAMVCLGLTIGPLGPSVTGGLVRVSLVPRIRVRINSRSQICLSIMWFYFQEVSFGNLLPIILLCVRNMEYYRFADNNWGYLPFSISKLHPHLFLVRS